MPPSTATPAVRLRPALALAAAGLLVAGCDDGTPPPPRQIPPPAASLPAPTAPAKRDPGVTVADVTGKWIVEHSTLREVVFNRALSVDQDKGTGYTDRELEEGTMHAVTEEMSRREQYTITSDKKFVITYGAYKDKIEGTWALEGDVLTLTPKRGQKVFAQEAHLAVPHQFKVKKGKLTWIPVAARYRPFSLVYDVPE